MQTATNRSRRKVDPTHTQLPRSSGIQTAPMGWQAAGLQPAANLSKIRRLLRGSE